MEEMRCSLPHFLFAFRSLSQPCPLSGSVMVGGLIEHHANRSVPDVTPFGARCWRYARASLMFGGVFIAMRLGALCGARGVSRVSG